MSKESYQSIPELVKRLSAMSERLESGSLNADQFTEMINETRELYDRLVVLRYKAFEEEVKGKKAPKSNSFKVGKSAKAAKAVVKEEKKSTAFQLDFNQQAEMTAEENIVPRNQVSLIDAIAEEESHDVVVPETEPAQTVEPVHEPEPLTEKEIISEVEPELDVEPVKEVQPDGPLEVELTVDDDGPKSINDAVSMSDSDATLAEKLRMRPISDIKKAIGINQKFLLMNSLFKGEHAEYHEALDRLNSCNGLEEAQGIAHRLGDQYEWDWEDESTLSLINLIERRYMMS